MSMMVASLASGSSGNSYYLQCSEGAILIDAGLSGRRLIENIVAAGGDPALVRGIIVTHDHIDHVAGAGVLQRKHGWRLWMTEGTRQAAAGRLGQVRVEAIRPGGGLRAAGFAFDFIPTPHDACEPVMVRAERGGRRCGVFTDLGHMFGELRESLEQVDFVFMESNYDPDILAGNPRYSYPLKKRISGERGHISNQECAELARNVRSSRLHRVVLSHLSQENNRPELARQCFTAALAERIRDCDMKVGVAPRHTPMLLCAV